ITGEQPASNRRRNRALTTATAARCGFIVVAEAIPTAAVGVLLTTTPTAGTATTHFRHAAFNRRLGPLQSGACPAAGSGCGPACVLSKETDDAEIHGGGRRGRCADRCANGACGSTSPG